MTPALWALMGLPEVSFQTSPGRMAVPAFGAA
jgi:hypothetical protein